MVADGVGLGARRVLVEGCGELRVSLPPRLLLKVFIYLLLLLFFFFPVAAGILALALHLVRARSVYMFVFLVEIILLYCLFASGWRHGDIGALSVVRVLVVFFLRLL